MPEDRKGLRRESLLLQCKSLWILTSVEYRGTIWYWIMMDLFTNRICKNRKSLFAERWSFFKAGERMCLGLGGWISLLDGKILLRCRSWSPEHVSMFLLSSHFRFPCLFRYSLNNPKENLLIKQELYCPFFVIASLPSSCVCSDVFIVDMIDQILKG